jgi:hypothetical protein
LALLEIAMPSPLSAGLIERLALVAFLSAGLWLAVLWARG